MTVSRPFAEQNIRPLSVQDTLPTMYDLPSEAPEEPGLPDEFHDLQPQLLSQTLRLTDVARDRIFTGTDSSFITMQIIRFSISARIGFWPLVSPVFMRVGISD